MGFLECLDVGQAATVVAPAEADGDALGDLGVITLTVVGVAEVVVEVLTCDVNRQRLLIGNNLIRHLLQHSNYILLQIPHPRLTHTIILHQRLYHPLP